MQKKRSEVLTMCVSSIDLWLMNDLLDSFLSSEDFELTSVAGNGDTWIYIFSAIDGSETHTITITL